MNRRLLLAGGAASIAALLGARWWVAAPKADQAGGTFPVTHTDAEWQLSLIHI